MSVAEMKKVLIEKVEKLSEKQPLQVSQLVDAIDKAPANENDLLPHVEQIIEERGELLKKLAK